VRWPYGKANNLRVFYIAGKRDLSNWEYMGRLVRRWQDIEDAIRDGGPGAWFCHVLETKVKPVAL
jgi:hypothetical protein